MRFFLTGFFLLTISFSQTFYFSQNFEKEVPWLSLDSVQILFAQKKKPILIDLYANWCTWCKVMDETTYKDPKVVEYLKENFYSVKFDAESTKEVRFFNQTFVFGSYGKIHDLAIYLTNGKMAFPTTIIIPASLNVPSGVFPGYLKPKNIEIFLKYYGEERYLKKSFPIFKKSFVNEW